MSEDLVRVVWTDAWFELDGYTSKPNYRVETVGWLIERGPFVVVAGEKTPDGWRAVTHIPTEVVSSVERLDSNVKRLDGRA